MTPRAPRPPLLPPLLMSLAAAVAAAAVLDSASAQQQPAIAESVPPADGSALVLEPAEAKAARAFWGTVNLGFAFLGKGDGASLLRN